jgi:glutamine synthetase
MNISTDPMEPERLFASNPEIYDVDLLIPDTNGVMRGKRLQRDALAKVYRDGLALPGSIFAADITGDTVEETGLGFDEGDADRLCWPLPGSLRVVPWEQGRAQALLTMHEADGRRFFADPRQVLRQVLERFEEHGLTPVVAVELEFYLIDRERTPSGAPQPPISPGSGIRARQTQVYSMSDLDENGALLSAVARACESQQIPAFTAVAEYAPGQFEVNLLHRPDVLEACDDAVLLKRLVKALTRQHGFDATFMAKPYPSQAGSGLHLHVSLQDETGANVFAGAEQGCGSDVLRHAVGGLATLLPESMALLAPNANSFRRYAPGVYVARAPTWGHNNRTVALRIPAGPPQATRIEHRVAGADANPYLVAAAVLAGIHYGLSNGCDPGEPVSGNADEQRDPSLPLTWGEALEAFALSETLPEYFGSEFCHVYYETRASERRKFQEVVTALEYDWYLLNP